MKVLPEVQGLFEAVADCETGPLMSVVCVATGALQPPVSALAV